MIRAPCAIVTSVVSFVTFMRSSLTDSAGLAGYGQSPSYNTGGGGTLGFLKGVEDMIDLDRLEQVEGTKGDHEVVLFALSTCPHCRHARDFLDANDVAYKYVYLDSLKGDEQKRVLLESEKYNPNHTFPTLV